MRLRFAGTAVIAAAVLLQVAPASRAGSGSPASTTFRPPYGRGPAGGDHYNLTAADPASGRVTVVRAYPYVGAFNCSGAGGFAYLRLSPVVAGPVTSVRVDVDGAAVDGYSWISVLVRDAAGRWLGGAKLRGPLAGPAQVTAPVRFSPAMVGHPMVVDVGLETASACPNAGGGTARFADVVVTGTARGGTGPAPGRGAGAAPVAPAVPSSAVPSSAVTTVNFEYQPGDSDPQMGARLPLRVLAGTGLVLLNGDSAAPHTLTAQGTDRDGRRLFDSGPPIDAGQAAPVTGVERLAPGAYRFYCRVHTQMQGVLEVVG